MGVSFSPAASTKALTAIRRTIRSWSMHRRSDKGLGDLARMGSPQADLRSTVKRPTPGLRALPPMTAPIATVLGPALDEPGALQQPRHRPCQRRVKGGKTLSEYIFSELPQGGDIIRRGSLSSEPTGVADHGVVVPSNATLSFGPIMPRDYPIDWLWLAKRASVGHGGTAAGSNRDTH
jgi:hypothetical protein